MIFSITVAMVFCLILWANENLCWSNTTMNMKRTFILLFVCLVTQIALGEPSLAEKNTAENAANKKERESWNAQPFWTAVASAARHRFRSP